MQDQQTLFPSTTVGNNDSSPRDLPSLLSYLEYLTDNKNLVCDFDSPDLQKSHENKSTLLLNDYISCTIPSHQLEFLLESQGIMDYGCTLEGYYHQVCTEEDLISELFTPKVKGDHYNPYIRYQSNCSSASRTCSKVLDLAGLEIYDISKLEPHHNIFLDIVCTFPSELDLLLLNEEYRSRSCYKISKNGNRTSQLDIKPCNLIDRMNLCRKKFFEEINSLFTYSDLEPTNQIMGCSSSLHVWGSTIPLLPNAHVHNFIPFFSYDKSLCRIEEMFDLFDCPELLPFKYDLLSSVGYVEYTSKKTNTKILGTLGCSTKSIEEVTIQEKYIVDLEKYKRLRLTLSNVLKDQLNMVPCDWFNNSFPVDIGKVKHIWSTIVYDEFSDILKEFKLLDIHIKFIPHYKKSKILHSLKYKSRPPVLDLDLFLKKLNIDLVTGYDSLNIDSVFEFLYYQLEIAVKCSDIDRINKLESHIVKLNQVVKQYSDQDLYKWLQFLCTWVTDTRVYGFWRNINRYLLDPNHEFLVVEDICPLCNGSITTIGVVDSCIVDCVIVQSRNKFCIYNLNSKEGDPH